MREPYITFIINDQNKAVADEGSHDDLVMSLALGAYAADKLFETTPMEASPIPHRNKEFKGLTPSIATVKSHGGVVEEDIKWLLS